MSCRLVDYYYTVIPDRPGAAAKLLGVFRDAGVNLRAVHAFPVKGRTQVDLVPADGGAFLRTARKEGLKLSRKKQAFLVEGKDRVGVLAGIARRMGRAGINMTAATGLRAGGGRFGAILWVKPRNVRRAAKVLGARRK